MGYDLLLDRPFAPYLKLNDLRSVGDSLTATGSSSWQAAAAARLFVGYASVNEGVGGTSSAQILTQMTTDNASNPSWAFRKSTIWAGENDIQVPGWDGTNTIANIASMVALCQPGWYRVFEVLPKSDGTCNTGTALRTILNGVNATLLSTYGSRFVPLLSALQAAGTGTGQDLTDVTNGVVPTSLRVDTIHMTNIVGNAPDATTGNGIVFAQFAASIAGGW